MLLKINGRERDVVDGSTIAQVVEAFGLKPATVVVEWNGDVVARTEFDRATPHEGDRLEIVRVVGGG